VHRTTSSHFRPSSQGVHIHFGLFSQCVLPGGGTSALPAAQEVRAHTDGQLPERGLCEATGPEYRYQVGREFPTIFYLVCAECFERLL